jgi:hypothetical protein
MIEKEFLYVGYYIDVDDNFILKIGTTHDLKERRGRHNRDMRKYRHNPMRDDSTFEYIWTKPLSKYNTLRYEDRNRETWKNMGLGTFLRNDRFLLETIPPTIPVKIRKEYQIALDF